MRARKRGRENRARPVGHRRESSGLSQQAERGEGERQRSWVLGPKLRRGEFSFSFISKPFQIHF
jgi:hypothetical protein